MTYVKYNRDKYSTTNDFPHLAKLYPSIADLHLQFATYHP